MPNLLSITLTITLSCALASAQQKPTRPPASDFNIEMLNFEGPSHLEAVPGEGVHSGLIATGNLKRLPEWKPTVGVAAEVAALKVEFWLKDNAVRVEVIAYLGKTAPYPRAPDLVKLQRVIVATRLVHENESVKISETEQFGIEALGFKVLRSNPWSIGPPEITNKTQSLTVTAISEERPAVTLTTRNVSPKCITSIRWHGLEDGHGGSGSGLSSKCLIPAAGVFDLRQQFALDPREQAEGVQPHLPQKREIVIEFVLFDDGTYEGNADAAATMAAFLAGEKIQGARVLQLLPDLAEAPVSDQAQTLARLKKDTTALAEEVDPATIVELSQRFAAASPAIMQRRIREEVSNGLRMIKKDFIQRIERFEYQREHTPAEADFGMWIKELKRIYDK